MAANITPPRPTAKGKGPHHYVPNQASSAGPTSSSSSTAGRSGSTATSLAMTPAEMNDHMGVNIPEAFYSPQAPAALRPTELPGRVGVTVLGLEKREDALQSSVRELVELGASPSRSSSFNNSRQGGGGALSTASTATSREHEEHHQKMRQEYYNEQNVAAPDSSAAKKLKKKKNYISRTQTYPGGPRGPPGAQAYLHSTSTPPPGGTASGRSSGVAQSAPRGGGVNRAYSPEFYENESNMKTVFSYHGIRVDGGQQSLFPDTPDGASSSSAGGLGRATQQEQTQRTERSLFFVVLGFVAVSVGIGILVLWCDLVHDETHSKNLHNYTGWCHAGLIDYIPRYFYASYSVFTITILAIFLSQHPSVRRGIREFKDAVRTNCFPHRYRALDEQESTYTMAASPWMNFQPGRHTSAAFETPIPTPLVPPGGLRQDMQQTRGRTETGRGTSSRIKKIRKKTAAIQGYIADHASLIGKKGSKKSMKAKSKFEKLQEQTRVLDKDASQSQTSSPDAAAIEQAANSIMLEVGGGVRPSPGQHQGSTASSSSTNIAMNKMREERIRSIGAGGGAPESNKARGFGIPLPPHGAGRGEPTSPILQHQNGLRFAAQHASPVYSEGTAGGWASCNDMEDEGGEAESDEEEEETSSEEEEEDGGDEILGYNGFLDLRQEVRELIFRELDDEKIAIIKQLIHDLDSGSIQRINPHMTRDLVISFCQFFGGAESGCMRFLKVTGWNRHKAMDRIARATLWRHFEMPKLDARARNVLDEFNADPKDGCFPCAGSYYKDREYCAYDGSPIELWRTCKINFNKAFGRYSELELELAYVHYVLRKEATCRRCKAQGVFALIDCKNTSVASIAWQTSKLRVMTTFMAKYGEQFFPDSISKALVYNAPKGADFIWKLFSSALSAATRERVQVISGDGKEEIAKLMDPRVVKQLEDLLPD